MVVIFVQLNYYSAYLAITTFNLYITLQKETERKRESEREREREREKERERKREKVRFPVCLPV